MDQNWISSLLATSCYPEPTSTVQHLQTHISHVFLTDHFAYKIKKSVNFGFLDFSSLDKRRHFCHEELRLNRRLAPDIYLEVVCLRDDLRGGVSFVGTGPIVDYAVKMRRMPQERMLATLLEKGEVRIADIDNIAATVAAFHACASRGNGIELFGTVEAIRANWLENLNQTIPYVGRTLTDRDHELIGTWAMQQLEIHDLLYKQRILDGHIIECHGDLHSGNICLDHQVHIFDCIEFNEKFRYSDSAADVAFLSMDLEFHRQHSLAQRFVDQYIQTSGDHGLRKVLPLYLTNRAFIRGKVESFRLDDPHIPEIDRTAAAERAQQLFRLAAGYILREQLPLTLFMTCGPTGSGKSAVAQELAFQLGLQCHVADCERKRLAGIAPTERNADIYSPTWNQATYQQLLKLAKSDLESGKSTIIDATFRSIQDRSRFIKLAATAGASSIILLPESPEALIRQRLEHRQKLGIAVSDGTWQIYERQMQHYQPPRPEEATIIRLDATDSVPAMVTRLYQETGLLKKKTKK